MFRMRIGDLVKQATLPYTLASLLSQQQQAAGGIPGLTQPTGAPAAGGASTTSGRQRAASAPTQTFRFSEPVDVVDLSPAVRSGLARQASRSSAQRRDEGGAAGDEFASDGAMGLLETLVRERQVMNVTIPGRGRSSPTVNLMFETESVYRLIQPVNTGQLVDAQA